jgi:CheY-like chemotaxis protein
MTKEEREPLILIVDDVPQFRQDLLPAMARMLRCRSIGTGTVHEAIQEAAKHDPNGDDPVDLVIVDMHMPYDETLKKDNEKTIIEEDAGTQCLQAIAQLKLLKCPCVVFTAYQSFGDCVAAVKAGADAYIPKVRRDDEGGPDALRETCERLLRSPEQGTEVPPTRAWIEKHHEWLTAEFNEKWVAFVPKEAVQNAEVLREPERDGVILLAGDSFEDVRTRVVEFPSVLRAQPTILMVRGKRSASRKE